MDIDGPSVIAVSTSKFEQGSRAWLADDLTVAVGMPDRSCPEPPCPRLWFAPWFVGCSGAITVFTAPACVWRREGSKITKTYHDDYVRSSGKPNPPPQIWILTGEVDHRGFHLGVWPD